MSAAIMAGISAASKVVIGGSRRNSAITKNAMRYGTDLASNEYRTTQTVSAAGENMKVAQANAGATSNTIALNEQATRAKQVSAQSVSGAEGGSADAVLNQTARNADVSQGQNTRALEQQEASIQQQTIDTIVGIDTQLAEEAPSETGNRTALLGGMAGLSTYGRLGGFS